MLAPMRIRAEPPPVFAGERLAARDRRRPLARMAHPDEARQARRKFLAIRRFTAQVMRGAEGELRPNVFPHGGPGSKEGWHK